MRLRIFTEPQQGATYKQLLTLARTAEHAGFDAFFRSDHVLAIESESGAPGYTDAWVTLAGLARDTSTIRLGTLVSPVTFREPGLFTVLATQVDHMSAGRLEVGLGAGWYGAEHAAYGVPFPAVSERYDRLEDQLAILHGVWSAAAGSTFETAGRTCSVRLEADALRPRQRPHPPIILGGQGGPRSARLAALYADEYNVPFAAAGRTREVHDSVRAACERAGRDPSTLTWSAAQTVCCGKDDAEVARRAAAMRREPDELRRGGVAGTPAEVVEKLQSFAAIGVERVYLQVLDLEDLDHVRLLAEEVRPHAEGR